MKRRIVVSVVLLATVVGVSVASAASTAPLEPKIGRWAAENNASESVAFRLVDVDTHYLAYSLSARVNAQCGSGGAVAVEALRARGVRVRLNRSGSGFAGSATARGRKGKERASVAVKVVITSARRAKVTLTGRSVTTGAPSCNGTAALTAKPR